MVVLMQKPKLVYLNKDFSVQLLNGKYYPMVFGRIFVNNLGLPSIKPIGFKSLEGAKLALSKIVFTEGE
jgi:hypothetical protein